MINQGTTSKNYYKRYLKMDIFHVFLGVLHCHRYDIPSAYNEKLGYVYDVLLTDENEKPVAICQLHPVEGDCVLCCHFDKGFDYFVQTFKSAYKKELEDIKYKKY